MCTFNVIFKLITVISFIWAIITLKSCLPFIDNQWVPFNMAFLERLIGTFFTFKFELLHFAKHPRYQHNEVQTTTLTAEIHFKRTGGKRNGRKRSFHSPIFEPRSTREKTTASSLCFLEGRPIFFSCWTCHSTTRLPSSVRSQKHHLAADKRRGPFRSLLASLLSESGIESREINFLDPLSAILGEGPFRRMHAREAHDDGLDSPLFPRAKNRMRTEDQTSSF